MSKINKFLAGEAFAPVGEREIRAICSNGQTDRSGDIVVQAGIDLANYRKNPVILFGHDTSQPVGRAKSIGVVNGQLETVIEFAPAGASAKADEICALAKAGILSTMSIGFNPVKAEPVDARQPFGPQRYLAIELLEISIVAVPALASAVVIERSLNLSPGASPREHRKRLAKFYERTQPTEHQIRMQRLLQLKAGH